MKTVLILAASKEMEQHLRKALGRQYRVIPVSLRDVEAFLCLCPDALILELSLPGCTGLDVLECCRPVLPPVVMALSTLTTPSVMEEAAAAGVTCMVRIPFTAREAALRLELAIKKVPPVREGKDRQKVTPYEKKLT